MHRKPLTLTLSPKGRGNREAAEMTVFYAPSPLRGEGWGEGIFSLSLEGRGLG